MQNPSRIDDYTTDFMRQCTKAFTMNLAQIYTYVTKV